MFWHVVPLLTENPGVRLWDSDTWSRNKYAIIMIFLCVTTGKKREYVGERVMVLGVFFGRPICHKLMPAS